MAKRKLPMQKATTSGARMGRASIFRDKSVRVQGIMSKHAAKGFERARKQLEALVLEVRGEKPTVVSDSDVIEYLSRGAEDARGYLAES